VDEAALRHGLHLMTDTEVERLEPGSGGEIRCAVLRDRQRGGSRILRARCYALAAGAIGSPAILLRSGIDGPHVGRHFMMHFSPLAAGVRRFGYHVELFLDEHEFGIFWQAHQQLPLIKIQLRFVRRDGLPHSPIGDRDCISADLFMRRSSSARFLRFMRSQLPHARYNPGKHSL
jgi:hypothetical protein